MATEVTSPAPIPADVPKEDGESQRRGFINASYLIYDTLGSTRSADKPAGPASTSHEPPISTPIFTTPYGTAPIQLKKEEPKPGIHRI